MEGILIHRHCVESVLGWLREKGRGEAEIKKRTGGEGQKGLSVFSECQPSNNNLPL